MYSNQETALDSYCSPTLQISLKFYEKNIQICKRLML